MAAGGTAEGRRGQPAPERRFCARRAWNAISTPGRASALHRITPASPGSFRRFLLRRGTTFRLPRLRIGVMIDG
jgi:hypothetical protein